MEREEERNLSDISEEMRGSTKRLESKSRLDRVLSLEEFHVDQRWSQEANWLVSEK